MLNRGSPVLPFHYLIFLASPHLHNHNNSSPITRGDPIKVNRIRILRHKANNPILRAHVPPIIVARVTVSTARISPIVNVIFGTDWLILLLERNMIGSSIGLDGSEVSGRGVNKNG